MRMLTTYTILIFNIIIVFSCSKQTTHFDIVKELEKERVLNDAKKFYNLKPIKVTAYFSERSAGTKHNFYSEGDYGGPTLYIPIVLT